MNIENERCIHKITIRIYPNMISTIHEIITSKREGKG